MNGSCLDVMSVCEPIHEETCLHTSVNDTCTDTHTGITYLETGTSNDAIHDTVHTDDVDMHRIGTPEHHSTDVFITNNVSVDTERISIAEKCLAAQKADDTLIFCRNESVKTQSDFKIRLSNNLLYRDVKLNGVMTSQLVVPKEYREQIMK